MYMSSIKNISNGLWLSGDGYKGVTHSNNYAERMVFYVDWDAEATLKRLNECLPDCYMLVDESDDF